MFEAKKRNVAKNYLFFAVFLFLFGIINPAISLADSEVFTGYKLPHALPWNDGINTWTKVRAYQSGGSYHDGTGSGTWSFYYHNEDNLFVSCNPNGACSNVIRNGNDGSAPSYNNFIGTYSCRLVTVTNILDSGNTYTNSTNYDYTTGSGCPNVGLTTNTCQYKHFSVGAGIYAINPSTTQSYDVGDACEDNNYIFETGDLVIPRVNIGIDGVTITGSPDPSPSIILNADTSEYVEVPSPVTDPGGFVAALLTNAGIWLYNLVIPGSGYFETKFSETKDSFDTKFAFVEQIQEAFVIPSASAFSSISLGSLSLGGGSTAPIAFISSFDPDTFATFRIFFSMVLYVGLGMFLLRKMSNIFSA